MRALLRVSRYVHNDRAHDDARRDDKHVEEQHLIARTVACTTHTSGSAHIATGAARML